jgi:hypothetical protein
VAGEITMLGRDRLTQREAVHAMVPGRLSEVEGSCPAILDGFQIHDDEVIIIFFKKNVEPLSVVTLAGLLL